jgi:hypothetical protein
MNTSDIRPPSPAASPRLSPPSPSILGCDLKVDNNTQPAPHDFHPVLLHQLDEWDERYNRRVIPLIERNDFDQLVVSILRDLPPLATTMGKVEAILAKRLQCDTKQLKTKLEASKREVFLNENIADELDDLLPFIRQETQHSWSKFIINALLLLSQLPSTKPPATTQLLPTSNMSKPRNISTPPNAITKPQPTKARTYRPVSNLPTINHSKHTEKRPARVQKTPKNGHARLRRSDRIQKATRKRVQ